MTSPEGISFRAAGAEDIPAIQTLAGRIWRSHYPAIISREQVEHMLGKMYSQSVLRPEIEGGVAYRLALFHGKPVGYLSCSHDRAAGKTLLHKLYLQPEFHGKGVGRAMLEEVRKLAQAAGSRAISLFVNKRNAIAIRAYERFGFKSMETVVTDFGGGYVMDDFRMEFSLPF